ncbi:MAG: sugar kinase [Treponema sp.]|jgi:sugar (pentulose or hexulose) kinase|nr:sugar kinase [Treponema sp.]
MAGTQAPVLLCADIGTSSLKAALIDTEGHEAALVREAYPQEGFASGAIHAADWENALARAWGRLASKTGAEPEALCISGNGPTLVPLTPWGEALAPLHWYGPRLAAGDSAHSPKPQSLFLPYVRAFALNRPEDYEKTAYLCSAQEWLAYRLGADLVTALPAAAYRPYYWDQGQCGSAGVDIRLFPPFVKLGSIIGKVSPATAARFGLPPGLPLVAGGPDFIMALIGVGALKPGMACDRAGTSEGINVCSPFPVSGGALRVLPHLDEGLWNISSIIPASGRLFEWFRTLTGQEERSYTELLAELIPGQGAFPASRTRFFPQDPLPGVFLSLEGPGLPSRQELGRAVLETMGFLVRDALAAAAGQGFPVKEMWVSGGQGKNPLWNQFKADLCGCTLLVPEIYDGELAGDAAVAAVALGESADLAEAVSRMIRLRARYVPADQTRDRYTEQYRSYRELKEKLRPCLT